LINENKDVVFQVDVRGPEGNGHGTGTVISKTGHVLTAYHVIEGGEDISLTIDDGSTPWPICHAAKVVVGNRDYDIVVLKIDRHFDRPARIADLKELESGLMTYSVGYPLNMGQSVWSGIVSVRLYDIPPFNPAAPPEPQLQAITFNDMTSAPGMSGAGVFSAETGSIVAMLTGGIRTQRFSQTIVQPVSKIRYVLEKGKIPYNEPFDE
jgi:S1-C subfamily serine protease